MRKINFLFSLLLTVAVLSSVSCTRRDSGLGKEKSLSFEESSKQFSNPGKEYRSAPLWTWNAKVTHEDIDRMEKDFKDQGFGGAFIHPRPGLETEYLSDEWFELWRYSVEKGKELGLDIWIYDENSYPSGFAGGHVQHEMPESYDHPTGLEPHRFDRIPENAGDFKICLKKEGDHFVDISDRTDEFKDKEGSYYCYKEIKAPSQRWLGNLPYVDLIYPGVTDKFIELTMNGYEKEFGNELGTTIKGIFTDEPQYQNWTPGIFEEFEKEWGYDLRPCLPMLLEETGDWKKVRFHFTATKMHLFTELWAKPWHEYCESHNMLWTGHYWEHNWPHVGQVGDNMAMYPYHQMPAIDMLFNQFNESSPQAQFGNVRSVKELRSSANQMGYTRTLCETYGGAGWDLTFEDMKRLGDWEYALGVNFMNQHYSNITIEGARKFDYPDFFTGYSPWGKDCKVLNDHFARLSLMLSNGEQRNNILVLEPTSTIWMYFTHRYNQKMVDKIGQNFQTFVTNLEKDQIEYDLGCESTIRDFGYVKGGKLVVGERSYDTVIIPEMTENLFSSTASMLEKFVAHGGRLIALSQPVLADGTESEILEKLWKESDKDIEKSCTAQSFSSKHISFGPIAGGNLFHQRREYKDGELLFLANSSLGEAACGSIRLKGAGLEELDSFSGDVYLYDYTVNDGMVEFNYRIPPAGSLLLFAPKSERKLKGLDKRISRKASHNQLAPVSELEVRRLGDNYLTLDFCDLSVDGKTEKDLFAPDACRVLFRKFGWNNPWETTVQYKRNIVDCDTLKSGDICVRYWFEVKDEFDYSSMKLVCEKPRVWTASINGHELSPIEGEHPLDARNGAFAIGEFVRKGRNFVELKVSPMTIYAEISYAFIAGDFDVVPSDGKWVIARAGEKGLGSWKDNGMPFYSWDVSYSKDYAIQNPAGGYVLRMGNWGGTVCELLVDGKKVGVLFGKTKEFDLTPYLKAGKNTVEVRCTGNLGNLFGPHFRPRRGIMDPGSWYAFCERRACGEYIFDYFGLEQPFELCPVAEDQI